MKKTIKNLDNPDAYIETILGNLLSTGVIIASSFMILGAVLFLVRHGLEIPNYEIFKPEIFGFSDFKNLFVGLVAFRSISIMKLGILVLIATPVLRVLFSVCAFAYQKDYMYIIFTAFVLCILIFSFVS